MQVMSAAISLEPNQSPRVTFGSVGRDLKFIVVPSTSLVSLAGDLLAKDHEIDVQIAATSVSVDSVSINIDPALDGGKRILGSQFIDRAVPAGTRRKVTGTIVFDYISKALYNDYINDTNKQLDIIITSVNDLPNEAGQKYFWHLFIPRARFEGEDPQPDSPGILKQTLNFYALATGEGLTDLAYLEVQNEKLAV